MLPVVRKAEAAIASDQTLNHEYLGQMGLEIFSQLATKMLLGDESVALKENRAFGIQSLSGTGALRLGADFLNSCADFKTVYISQPSWREYYASINLISKVSFYFYS